VPTTAATWAFGLRAYRVTQDHPAYIPWWAAGLDLRITSVFWYHARGLKPRASFRFTGCCWWRPLAVDGGSGTSDGGSGTSGGHVWSASVARRPGARRRQEAARWVPQAL